MIDVQSGEGSVRFNVRVQPRASRSEIVAEYNGGIKIRLAAPPVDGAANEALVDFLAKHLGVAKRNVRIVAGLSSRNKTVEVAGVEAAAIHGLVEEKP